MKFPKQFFQEETREGFLVSELMKRAWAAEIEVLQVVAEVCERNDITWFADWGTLLGAVRHHGFVPWDDDIDICLFRPEYDRLVKLLRTELPEGFVLAGAYAEEERLQLANVAPQSRVIADEECWDLLDTMKRFHGFPFFRIGIDIYPIDCVPDDPKLFAEQKNKMLEVWRVLGRWAENETYSISVSDPRLKRIEEVCGVSFRRDDSLIVQLRRLYDFISAQYMGEETEYVGQIRFLLGGTETCYRRECLQGTIWMPFEHISLPVPVGYDEILTAYFGDYMTAVRGASAHSYPFYKEQQKELEKLFKRNGIARSIPQFCREYMSLEEQAEGGNV